MIRKIITLCLLAAMATITGCAGSAPSANFKRVIVENMRLCKLDEAKVRLTKADGVEIDNITLQRLENGLQNALDKTRTNAKCATDVKRTFTLDGKIIRYESGNAFARAMLAGLGQIHIDGEFVLYHDLLPSEPVAEFTLEKTFAWGGIYGASTRIEDVEPAFCEGVAKTICKID